jgi:hypothetical protein
MQMTHLPVAIRSDAAENGHPEASSAAIEVNISTPILPKPIFNLGLGGQHPTTFEGGCV